MNAHVDPPVTPLGKFIESYLLLRDKVAEMDKAHKDKRKPFVEAMDQLEGVFLDHLNKTGLDNLKGSAGTAYKTTKKSATIADGAAFRRFVIGAEAWDLADWKANAPAVAEFIEANKAPPPGVNYSTRVEVNVTRSK